MTSCPAYFSSLLHVSNCRTSNPDASFPKINFLVPKKPFFHSKYPIALIDSASSSVGSRNSTTITNSLTLDHGNVDEEELEKAESKYGSKVRVKVPLKVYHVPKVPEIELTGRVGVLKQYVGVHKGKRISANLPYKVEFVADEVLGRDGKPVKFTAHLREDEFEFLD